MRENTIYKIHTLILYLFIISCSNGSNNSDENIVVFYNKNIPSNPNLTLKLEKKFELETNDSISERRIKGYSDLILAKNGHIFVSDRQNIKKYDPNGKLIKVFSGKGVGPGEFEKAGSIFFLSDTLYAVDAGTNKCNLFSTDGSFYKSKKMNNIVSNDYLIFQNRIIIPFMNYTPVNDSGGEVTLEKKIYNSNFQHISTENIFKKKIDIKNATQTDFLLRMVKVGNKLHIARIDEDQFQIDVYDDSFKKIELIQKSYIKVKLNDIDREMLSGFLEYGDAKSSVSKAVYSKSILGMWCDKYERLLVLTASKQNLEDKAIYLDVFNKGRFLNTVKIELPELKELASKISVPKFLKFEGNYLFVYNYYNNTYSAYDYKYEGSMAF